ncbi:hypothetical protein D3C81_1712060 [compost metagenome]
MPRTSRENNQAKPSMRRTRFRPRLGNQRNSSRMTPPWAICGYSKATWTVPTRATSPASNDSLLRALCGKTAARQLPINGRSSSTIKDIDF